LVPIEKAINTPTFRDQINKMAGIKSNFDAHAASATNEDYLGYTQQELQSLAERYQTTPENVLAAIKRNQGL